MIRKQAFAILFSLGLFFMCCWPAHAKMITIAVPRLSVWTIENTGQISATNVSSYSPWGGTTYSQINIQNGRSRLKEIELPNLTDVFIRHLTGSGKLTVLERAKVDKVLGEININEAGLTDPASAIKKGEMLGAEYLIVGTVFQADLGFDIREIPYTEQQQVRDKGVIRVELRFIETATGKITSSVVGEGIAVRTKSLEKKVYGARLEKYDPFFDMPFMHDLYDALANDLTTKTVNAFFPFSVIVTKDNMVTANRGSNFAINAGDIYNVIRTGEPIKDPDTGKIIGKQETVVGKATVKTVQQELCTLSLTGVKGDIRQGDILKPATDPYENLKVMDRF
jgi:curli biogenesis system outer membrane secretion channel CsgG